MNANRIFVVSPHCNLVFDASQMLENQVYDHNRGDDPSRADLAEVYLFGQQATELLSREELLALAVLQGDRQGAAILADLVQQGWLEEHPAPV